MEQRIIIGNRILIILCIIWIIVASSCAGPKVYNSRTSGINGKTGAHTAEKTQNYYNHNKALKRVNED